MAKYRQFDFGKTARAYVTSEGQMKVALSTW